MVLFTPLAPWPLRDYELRGCHPNLTMYKAVRACVGVCARPWGVCDEVAGVWGFGGRLAACWSVPHARGEASGGNESGL
jgi:hypothetical protein